MVNMQQVLDILTILVYLLPLVIKLLQLIAAKTNDQHVKNLVDRATVIVSALEQSGLTNEQKKQEAINKLSYYANEANIKVTPDQVDDYIESAVRFLKHMKEGV